MNVGTVGRKEQLKTPGLERSEYGLQLLRGIMTDGNRNGNFVLKAVLTFQNFMLSNWDESPSWVTGLICETHVQYF